MGKEREREGRGGSIVLQKQAEPGIIIGMIRDSQLSYPKEGRVAEFPYSVVFFENNNNNRKKPAKNLPNTQNILSANGHSKQKYSYQLWAGHTLHIEAQTTQSNHHDNKASHLSHESHFHQMAVHKPHTQNVLDATSGLGL